MEIQGASEQQLSACFERIGMSEEMYSYMIKHEEEQLFTGMLD
jgi:hypothetical protein